MKNFDDFTGDPQQSCLLLLSRAVAGDMEAATLLYPRSVPSLCAWLAQRLPHPLAEEVAHDTLLKILRTGVQPPQGESFLSWLHSVAWQLAVQRLREERERMQKEQEFGQHLQLMNVPAAEPVEQMKVLAASLAALPQRHRKLLRLYYFQKQTSKAIAKAQGRTRSAVAVQIHRICEQLRHETKSALHRTFQSPLPGSSQFN
ncbi:RNA polymerase sigma factor [Prosthecobacter dejongeii]|uniref:RNA polymerase sigma factor (Sigma-70 family) n=1 Tax=Prosthecobacter dejongeii TaxID=48465 RepID=A0A7W8DP11_9BACT|nr:RNA polymerase sigma factor [Prosthecobacter dejongeii]MBB5036650.1 RNA polymerase sigma factor (sigma-70 family) [Prosthecobacter dejongeii]